MSRSVSAWLGVTTGVQESEILGSSNPGSMAVPRTHEIRAALASEHHQSSFSAVSSVSNGDPEPFPLYDSCLGQAFFDSHVVRVAVDSLEMGGLLVEGVKHRDGRKISGVDHAPRLTDCFECSSREGVAR